MIAVVAGLALQFAKMPPVIPWTYCKDIKPVNPKGYQP